MGQRPAARFGVGPSVVALPKGPWPTMLAFLVERFAHVPPEQWLARLQSGGVLNEQGQPLTPDAPYAPQAHLYYYRELPSEPQPPEPARVLYQDEHLVVADKPHFMSVTPGGQYLHHTLLVSLRRQLGLEQLQPLHRLDRDTAGLVLLGVRPQDRNAYHALFREHLVAKTYQAIAPWQAALQGSTNRRSRLESDIAFFRMREVDGPPNAETHIEMLQGLGPWARYRLQARTGQRHQLRVHMAALGAPLRNDPFYPVVTRGPNQPDDWARPLQLLAQEMAFQDPITGQARHFVSARTLALDAAL